MLGTIYIIGCIFATFIVINEYLTINHKHDETAEDYDEEEELYYNHQYGLSIVVILLSWVAVAAWLLGRIKNK